MTSLPEDLNIKIAEFEREELEEITYYKNIELRISYAGAGVAVMDHFYIEKSKRGIGETIFSRIVKACQKRSDTSILEVRIQESEDEDKGRTRSFLEKFDFNEIIEREKRTGNKAYTATMLV